MADELDPITPDPATPDPQAAPTPETADGEADTTLGTGAAEVDAVEVSGSKYVPVAAVLGERKQRQAAQTQLTDLQAQFQQLQDQYRAIEPYARVLQQHPHLLQPREPAPSGPPAVDPELADLAVSLDLYDPKTGEPDIKRAARVSAVLEKRTRGQAEALVQPLAQQTLLAKAQQNYTHALAVKGPDGRAIDRAVLDDLWRQAANEPGGLQTLSDPRAVAALVLMAAGASSMGRPGAAPAPVAPPQSAPLETEASGGLPRGRPFLSTLEQTIAKQRGLDAEKWTKVTAGFTRGAGNTLED